MSMVFCQAKQTDIGARKFDNRYAKVREKHNQRMVGGCDGSIDVRGSIGLRKHTPILAIVRLIGSRDDQSSRLATEKDLLATGQRALVGVDPVQEGEAGAVKGALKLKVVSVRERGWKGRRGYFVRQLLT